MSNSTKPSRCSIPCTLIGFGSVHRREVSNQSRSGFEVGPTCSGWMETDPGLIIDTRAIGSVARASACPSVCVMPLEDTTFTRMQEATRPGRRARQGRKTSRPRATTRDATPFGTVQGYELSTDTRPAVTPRPPATATQPRRVPKTRLGYALGTDPSGCREGHPGVIRNGLWPAQTWWAILGSNQRPLPCQAPETRPPRSVRVRLCGSERCKVKPGLPRTRSDTIPLGYALGYVRLVPRQQRSPELCDTCGGSVQAVAAQQST